MKKWLNEEIGTIVINDGDKRPIPRWKFYIIVFLVVFLILTIGDIVDLVFDLIFGG